MDKENKIILYKDDDGKVSVNTRFADEDVWLTQAQLAEIYQTTKQNVSQHIDKILSDGELDENRTVKNFLTVREEGKRKVQRDITHYNLDMIIALGYRVQSPIAVRFRRWATQRLHEYIQKGFTMDDERLPEKLQYLRQSTGVFGASTVFNTLSYILLRYNPAGKNLLGIVCERLDFVFTWHNHYWSEEAYACSENACAITAVGNATS